MHTKIRNVKKSVHILIRGKKAAITTVLATIILILSYNFFLSAKATEFIRSSLSSLECYIYTAKNSVSDILYSSYEVLSGQYNERMETLKIENLKLKCQLLQLETLKEDNSRLIKLAESVGEFIKQTNNSDQQKQITKIIVARVISITGTDYISSILINKGEIDGIKLDDIAINESGIIGRVININKKWSKILLTTDVNSSVPVYFSSAEKMAIISGTNSNKLKISMKHGKFSLTPGEIAFSSGYGGIYPASVPVGTVQNDTEVIKPAFNINKLGYVCIINSL